MQCHVIVLGAGGGNRRSRRETAVDESRKETAAGVG